MDWMSLTETYTPDPKKPFSAIIFGRAGSGKTTLASTFPTPFFIDPNRGLGSLTGNVQRFRVADLPKPVIMPPPLPGKPTVLKNGAVFDAVYQILLEARDKKGPFAPGGPMADIKTIVIDDLTDLANNYMMGEIMAAYGRDPINGKASYDDFGVLVRRLQALFNLIKDISDAGSFYVLVTAPPHEDVDEDTKVVSIRPEVMGGFRSVVGAAVDEEWFLVATEMNGSKKVNLHTASYMNAEAKTRKLNVTKLENPTYATIKANLKETPVAVVKQ